MTISQQKNDQADTGMAPAPVGLSDDKSPIVITARGVSKKYRVSKKHYLPVRGILAAISREAISNFLRSFGLGGANRRQNLSSTHSHEEFLALNDVSFRVARGEAFGILGRNGAGKSTLLQIVVGTLQPTSGTVDVSGRIGALLELGSGLNPEYTGRENIFLGAAILGLSQEQTKRELEKVISFANIGQFIDQPIRTYSSGMQVRLAFAINACLEPDVLIIDEALAVGDAPFQAKCYRHLRALQERGTTILFTSHSIDTVRSLCSRAMWLDEGKIRMIGEAKEVAKAYERFCWQAQGTVLEAGPKNDVKQDEPETPLDAANSEAVADDRNAPQDTEAASAPEAVVPATDAGPGKVEEPQDVVIEDMPVPPLLFEPNQHLASLDADLRYGTGRITIRNLVMTDEAGEAKKSFAYGETAILHYLLDVHERINRGYQMGVQLKDVRGSLVASYSDIYQKIEISWQAGDLIYAQIPLSIRVTEGPHTLVVSLIGADRIFPGRNYDFSQSEVYDCIETALLFEMEACAHGGLAGPVHLDAPISFRAITETDKESTSK